ncbi:MAG TPA: hypothetical protein VFA20_10705 [Myxococcaceae bacterium]|nr:hypothetical protein [Myxococcaceae bacterium]
MEWVTEPPCTELDVERDDLAKGMLILKGPRGMARAKGGLVAAMGAAFAAGAVAFLRMPFPKAWKLIPAAMAITGGGMAAAGAVAAISDVRIQVERGKGIRWTWRPRPAPEREVFLPAKEISTFEVKTNITRTSNEFSFQDRSETTFSLMVIDKQAKAYAIEVFHLHSQAELRREQIEKALGAKAKSSRPKSKKKASAA